MNFNEVIIFGISIHVVFILSIFDIYFKSPLVDGVEPTEPYRNELTQRVVLISVDGLRIDSLFDKFHGGNEYVAPYIRQIIENVGSWGLSQSHLPTESRPGHVAMLAGFYEDPSAVTKGWKHNPVSFDSLFNRSKCVFAWGSPDIVPMFSEGVTNKDCVHVETYDAHDQKFAGTTTEYDNWVYAKLNEYMMSPNIENMAGLHDKGILFFLHLLGQDISGHTDKPHSSHYRMNLKNVDNLVRKIVTLFQEVYKDSKTTFILTSDHGMTDWGSHGSGNPSETNTPLVAWGAGIAGPEKGSSPVASPWGLSHIKMKNVQQADVTPLVAVLLNVPIPVNSVGQLPYSYIDAPIDVVADAMFTNTLQMIALLRRKAQIVQQQLLHFFFSPCSFTPDSLINQVLRLIQEDIHQGKFNDVIDASHRLTQLIMKGLDYYHNYYQRPLLFLISSSYILWTFTLLFKISFNISLLPSLIMAQFDWLFISLISITSFLLFIQRLPLLFYFYFNLPLYLVWILARNKDRIVSYLKRSYHLKQVWFHFLVYVCGIEVLVVSFFHRWALSFVLFFNLIWLLFLVRNKALPLVLSLWIISGLSVCVFPLLPVIGQQPRINVVLASGLLWVLLSLFVSLLSFHKLRRNALVTAISVVYLVITVWNIHSVHNFFRTNRELSGTHQFLSFALWFASYLNPFFTSRQLLSRLLAICLSLTIPFLLMTVNHEALFLLALIVNLFCWLHLEHSLSSVANFDKQVFDYSFDTHIIPDNGDKPTNFRIAFFFLTYIFVGFFGIGNIANLNSFDPSWVRCFITTFSPFTMSALILFKTVIPFLIISCFLRGIALIIKIKTEPIFVIVLVFCNLMGLNFLFLVTNQGSWLEIGTSISHYIIQQATVLFLVLLYKCAQFLTMFSLKIPSPLILNSCERLTLPQSLPKMD